mgnify:CR=1 FL=1
MTPGHRGNTRSYTIDVSTYMLIVLLLFNQRTTWSMQDLRAVTNIPYVHDSSESFRSFTRQSLAHLLAD